MKLEKSKEKKEGFHITITNLTSGKTIIDTDSKAIIGGVDCGDSVKGIGITACNTTTLINTVNIAENVVNSTKKEVVKKLSSEIASGLFPGDDDEDEDEEEDDDE